MTFKQHIPLIVLFTILVITRFIYIPINKAWYDEIITIQVSQLSVREILTETSLETNTPTYYILIKVFTNIFGTSEAAFRAFSLIFSVLCIFPLYKLCVTIFRNTKVAKIAGILLIISPYHFYYSSEIRVYSMAITVSAIILLAYFKLVTDSNKSDRQILWTLVYIISTIAGMLLHPMFIILYGLSFIWLLIIHQNKRVLIANCIVFIFFALLYLAKLPTLFIQLENAFTILTTRKFMQYDNLNKLIRLFWFNYNKGYMVITLLTGLLGIKYLINSKNTKVFLLFLTILFSAYIFPINSENAAKYVFFAFIPLLIFGASGINFVLSPLYRWVYTVKSTQLVTFLGFILVTGLISTFVFINTNDRKSSCISNLAPWVDTLDSSYLILVTPNEYEYELEHYANNQHSIIGINTVIDPQGNGINLYDTVKSNWYINLDASTVTNLDNYIKNYTNIVIIDTSTNMESKNLLQDYLKTKGSLIRQDYNCPYMDYTIKVLSIYSLKR